MRSLAYEGKDFLLDEEPFRILSGAIHYFRVVPQYWEDRLMKLKACGFNTVETYICWNLHERKEGEFDFTGMLDLIGFIEKAKELDLYVIIRPGPYICAEWDMGGLPSWLLSYKGIRLRCYEPIYLSKISAYLSEICNRIRPYLLSNGGNIIALQIENEYGSYGNDKKYLEYIKQLYLDNDMNCLYFTADGPTYFMLNGGSLPNILMMLNFGNEPKKNFEYIKELRPNQPLMCCEYWNGWFDHWFEKHHKRCSNDTKEIFKEILDQGASVNFYMFHGGTNFSFYNGSNFTDVIQPIITSYDYNCPITESGDLTEKYYEIKGVIKDYFGIESNLEVKNMEKKSYGVIELTHKSNMLQSIEYISSAIRSSYPMTMEEVGQDFGFILYRTTVRGPVEELELTIDGLHDRALIYFDKKMVGIKDRLGRQNDKVLVKLNRDEKIEVDIFVENMGRINYGSKIGDEKGIVYGVKIGQQYQYGYEIYPIPCDNLSQLTFDKIDESIETEGPVFLLSKFYVEESIDTFVKLDGFTKGNVFINGFNLGRYWNVAGPQKTLYLPAPLLKIGENEIIVLELESYREARIQLVDTEELGE